MRAIAATDNQYISKSLSGNDPELCAFPLEGIRVIDLGQVWAGPLLGRYLADYEA
ncbi:MAG TPA: hypothetical protein EYO82_03300, partial [Gammaproteobacteria bacterium]|nr:hypothetical protein [Gammaproteobacteria bacterium]